MRWRSLHGPRLLVAMVGLVVLGGLGAAALAQDSSPAEQDRTIGHDGLPISLMGEEVLRADATVARIGSGGSFLAAGTLLVSPAACGARVVREPVRCVGGWVLSSSTSDGTTLYFALPDVESADGFVATSGALAVVSVDEASGPNTVDGEAGCAVGCRGALHVSAIAWRFPTRGRVPEAAFRSSDDGLMEALVPDYVAVWDSDGVRTAGYITKEDFLQPAGGTQGTPQNPPQMEPIPVVGEDLTTVVGHQVPGVGFVPLGSMPSIKPGVPAASSQPGHP